jgi:hypothetical protein
MAFTLTGVSPSLKLAAIYLADNSAHCTETTSVDVAELARFCCCEVFTAHGLLDELFFKGVLSSVENTKDTFREVAFSHVANPGPNESTRPSISKETRDFIQRRDKECIYCGTRHEPYHIDHIIPISRGGSDQNNNLALACATCNISKRDRLISEWNGPKDRHVLFDRALAIQEGRI